METAAQLRAIHVKDEQNHLWPRGRIDVVQNFRQSANVKRSGRFPPFFREFAHQGLAGSLPQFYLSPRKLKRPAAMFGVLGPPLHDQAIWAPHKGCYDQKAGPEFLHPRLLAHCGRWRKQSLSSR